MIGEGGDLPVPLDREMRVQRALSASLEALKLARREAEAAAADPARQRWAALGLVSALQGALVAALSGYESADLDAVLNPSQRERIAPVALLLRRARSGDYLNAPERVDLPGSRQRALDRVISVRNAAVHALSVAVPATFAEDARVATELIAHLVLEAPAFDPARVGIVSALIADELKALNMALRETPAD